MVVSKEKPKTKTVELIVGQEDFTSIFKEIKYSLKQLKNSNPQDVFKLINKESYKTIKENNQNAIVDWKFYDDNNVSEKPNTIFKKPYSSAIKNKRFFGFHIYYSLEDKQFHLTTDYYCDIEGKKVVYFEKILDTQTGQSDIVGFSTSKKRRNQLLYKIHEKTVKQIESIFTKMISDDRYLTMSKVEYGEVPIKMLSDEQIKRYFHSGINLGKLWRFKDKVSLEQWNRIILLINSF